MSSLDGGCIQSSSPRTSRRWFGEFESIQRIIPSKKILWRDSLDQEVRTYCLKTVTFGFTSSPYLAIRTLLQLSEDEGDNYPLATEILRKEIYVSTAQEKHRQVDLLLREGGFTLKKWVSNVEEVLQGVPTEHREDATSFLLHQDPYFRALGILWQPSSDYLRWLGSTSGNYCELHSFKDASEKAIGAVVYLRITTPSNLTRVTLVTAKTKVALLKETSIPRLELCAAVLLVRLVSHVRSVLSLYSSTPIHLLSDSENTLDWIRRHPLRWKTYMSNRVSEIQRILPEAFWHHVPGVDNPADCVSRGITPVRLEHHLLWWQGSVGLAKPENFWPRSTETIDLSVDREERVTTHSALVDQETPWRLLTQYSPLTKLLRINALCLQFVDRLRRKQFERPPCHPTTAYLKKAQEGMIGHVQRQAFSEDIIKLQRKLPVSKSSPLLKLLPFLDSDGLLRLGGRQAHAVLDYEKRCPYILPKDSLLTTLIVRNGRQFILHGGPQLTLSYFRRKYWILSSRTDVKRVLARCVVCARYRANPCNQVMSPLPSFRVTPPIRPFAAAGLDYTGPIWMRTTKGRDNKAYIGYIAIFVCCATRALHLEAVSVYTADDFIAAYKRFSARRGVSYTLYSDNGTTFVGAYRQLREPFTQASAVPDKVTRYLADNHTTWKFNPPAAPQSGGLWEAAVRSVKCHLRRVIGDTTLTFEMSTFLAQVEPCLNSRPIQYLKDDPNDLVALTPAHFLIGSSIFTIPEPTLVNVRLTPRELAQNGRSQHLRSKTET